MIERTHFIVKESAANMPASCWGRYARLAVIEVQPGVDSVSMISERARGVVRIVRTWEKLHAGSTSRCARDRALDEAEELAARLNDTERRVVNEVKALARKYEAMEAAA